MPETLAAVVAKPDVDAAIAALREAGVYDDARRVRERDADTVEVPVTAPPEMPLVDEVVRQADPDLRERGLATLLRERGWDGDAVDRAPSSWAVVGTVVLVAFGDCERREEVADALLTLHGEADTVLAREGIVGEHREPRVAVVAGEGDTETVHTEHGTQYALDLAEVMFSPGNKAERARMGEVVSPGERVLDMFAGVGYFTLPMARAGAHVTAVERNPTAFRYLLENAVLNGVQDNVSPVRADCRDVTASAERVVMGYYDAPDYLDAALDALDPGGVLHLHAAVPERLLWDDPLDRLMDAARERGRGDAVEVLDRRTVKTTGEGVRHVVVDARVG